MTRTIAITGAGRGIGYEIARQAEAAGFDVISIARGAEKPLVGTALEGVDVTSPDAMLRVADALAGRPIDILVNNAGVIGPGRQSTLEMDFDGFLRTFDVNTLGPLRAVHALLPNMRLARDARGSARIVTISSRMGSLSYAKSDRIAYRASKAAVNKVMQGLATDLAGEAIFVRSVHPGWVRTDMGGSDADIDAPEAAAGVLDAVRTLDAGTTGSFVSYDGTTLDW